MLERKIRDRWFFSLEFLNYHFNRSVVRPNLLTLPITQPLRVISLNITEYKGYHGKTLKSDRKTRIPENSRRGFAKSWVCRGIEQVEMVSGGIMHN